MRLLVGLDRREGGQDALELARVLAGGEGSALLVSVLYSGPLPLEYALLPPEDAAEAEPLFEAARERLAGMRVEDRAYGGGSAAAILTELAEADEGGFDAIVVGSPHRGAIGRVMIGSVATGLLNGAPTDVAVAPRGYAQREHEPPRQIAVGYDGGEEARAALRSAERIAERSRARIEVLTVVSPPVATPAMVPGAYAPPEPAHPERVIAEGLDSVESSLAAAGERLDGDPATELARRCESVDLLVVGSRGYGPLARTLLGSVSRHLVTKAPCPVMVVARPSAKRKEGDRR